MSPQILSLDYQKAIPSNVSFIIQFDYLSWQWEELKISTCWFVHVVLIITLIIHGILMLLVSLVNL